MRRTALTGIGVVAPGGVTRDAFWELLSAGRTATRRITFFDPSGFRSQIAAECDFDPAAAGLSDDDCARMDRYVQFAVAAAVEAVADSGLVFDRPERVGVALGSAVGGTTRLEADYVAVSDGGREWLVDPSLAGPHLYEALVPSSLASEVAARFGAHGPAVVISTGCTSGIDAVGYGHQLIQDGEADIVIAGASESGISPISMACFDPIRATSARNEEPASASRPFDGTRDGFVMGEGGAVLILEELSHAQARGAHIYCEISGYAGRGNAFHMTGLKPDGLDMAEAISDALRQGGTDPSAVDYVNAHGSGTQAERRPRDGGVEALARCARAARPGQLDQVDGRPLARWHRSDRDRGLSARDRARPRTADREPDHARSGVRSGLRAACRAQRRHRRRAVHRQRLRRLSVRDRPGGGGGMITSLPDLSRRPVVTGIGVVAPTGIGTEAWWDATLCGDPGIGPITRFDASRYATRFAGEVAGFDASGFIPRRLAMQTDRWTWMGLAAAEMAFADAGFDPGAGDPYRQAVITASSSGGNEFGQVEIQKLWGKGPEHVGAYQSIAWFYAATTGQISIKHGMKGHCGVVASEGAGALEALASSRRALRRGMDAVVSGGLEAPIGPYALCCQTGNGLMSTLDSPDAYRPFDERASGYLPGEGGAVLLVETAEAALARGAQVYGEIAGYGATHDGGLASDGVQLARAIRLALDDAGVAPEGIDVVFADGAGSVELDLAEARALKAVFGIREVPVTVPKAAFGRTYAGGAALDVAAALLSLRDGRIPPTINVERPAHDLRLVLDHSEPADLHTALVVARGYGGFNSAAVLRRATPTQED